MGAAAAHPSRGLSAPPSPTTPLPWRSSWIKLQGTPGSLIHEVPVPDGHRRLACRRGWSPGAGRVGRCAARNPRHGECAGACTADAPSGTCLSCCASAVPVSHAVLPVTQAAEEDLDDDLDEGPPEWFYEFFAHMFAGRGGVLLRPPRVHVATCGAEGAACGGAFWC